MNKYNYSLVENKWIKIWDEKKLYQSLEEPGFPKSYVLDMFPYPSGSGLHVGHVEGYTGTDIYARYMRMNGKNVLHPMGWDAFGLPAENYAIKKGIEPDKSTHDNIDNFRKWLIRTGLSYDWSREVDSSSPDYYKWTQWVFIKLWEHKLAYRKKAPANWCPSCETVLANEQVINGHCERCDTLVERRELEQWFFKITDYADRLIEGLDRVEWPNSTKIMQRNWIGKSQGHKIKFDDIEVFTTCIDTLHGATFVALAPDHPKVIELKNTDKGQQIEQFIKSIGTQTFKSDKDKQGIFTGGYVKNPATGKSVPVWVVNYVSSDYGTGAIMGVPSLDERDREFATKYQIDILDIKPDSIMEKYGQAFISYHLRDWLISRQRYWGAPIPMTFCDKCGWQAVPEAQLPVKLPTDVDFRPTGESPIARSKEFQQGVVCANCSGPARREVDTMDTFVDSSWYFLRFTDPRNIKLPFDIDKADYWAPVDLYVGGAEHTVLHLMYSRFFYKFFHDIGLLDAKSGDEPFLKLRHQGTILGPDNRKMSKRWGNVVTLEDAINKYGADVVRMYEMFMGPFEAVKPWSLTGVEGVSRFMSRLIRFFEETNQSNTGESAELDSIVNKLVGKVGEDIQTMSFNTAVSTMMGTLNELQALFKTSTTGNWPKAWNKFILVLAPFAPFLAEELYQTINPGTEFKSVHLQTWPEFDSKLSADSLVTIVVQVNGNMRDRLVVDANYSNDQNHIEQLARSSDKVSKHLNGAKTRTIFVPGKIINLVTI